MAKKSLDDIPDLLPLLSDAGASTADAVNANSGKKRSFITTGEHIHKWGTYLGVDWLYNAAVGVGFAMWGKCTNIGKKIWSGPIEKMFTALIKPYVKNPDVLEHCVGRGNMFVSIITGGMLTIPPLMVLENSKVKKSIVKFFDRFIYGKDKVENDPKFQQAYEEIKEAPKKGFWAGTFSRYAALTPLLATTVFIPFTSKWLGSKYFGPLTRASEKIAEKIGFTGKKLKNIHVRYDNKDGNAWGYMHENVSFDLGQGIPYAVLHAGIYNIFAGMGSKKKDKTEKKSEPKVEPHIEPQTNPPLEAQGVAPDAAVVATAAEKAPAKKFTDRKDINADASHAAGVMNRKMEAEAAPAVTV